jgi:hypothetical protein
MACQTKTAFASECGTSAFGGARQLKLLSSLMSHHRPERIILQRWTSSLISAVYPIEIYSKKNSPSQSGELCSNRPKISTSKQYINVDNKAHFRYPDDYSFR